MRLIDLDQIEYFTLVDKWGVPRYKIEIGEDIGVKEVNAIPIEWFNKQIDWHLETRTYGAEVYQWVLNRWYEDKEAWEKENERP